MKDLPFARLVRDASQSFIAAFRRRRTSVGDFPRLVRELVPCFQQTADALPRGGDELKRTIAVMEGGIQDLAALQKAHRAYLLKLQALLG